MGYFYNCCYLYNSEITGERVKLVLLFLVELLVYIIYIIGQVKMIEPFSI
jgi:hypothetical protein